MTDREHDELLLSIAEELGERYQKLISTLPYDVEHTDPVYCYTKGLQSAISDIRSKMKDPFAGGVIIHLNYGEDYETET